MPEPAALSDLPPLRDVVRRHGLAARRDLGQHFLLDANLTDRIARAARDPGEADLSRGTVIEVGPGPVERLENRAGSLHVRVAGRDERHQTRPPVLPQPLENLSDA